MPGHDIDSLLDDAGANVGLEGAGHKIGVPGNVDISSNINNGDLKTERTSHNQKTYNM